MTYKKLPDGVLEFVKMNAAGKSDKELASMTNTLFGTSFTDKSIKNYRRYHGIRNGSIGKPPSLFPPKIQEYVRTHCEGVPYREMTNIVNDRFGTTFTQNNMRWFYQNNKLKCGVRTSWNKANPGEVSQKKDGYQYIKTEDGKWKLYHHEVWEKEHGQIPEGFLVTFLDGNIRNVDIKNLALVSREELMLLTKDNLRFSDPRLNETGILIARVKVAASRQNKRRKKNEPRDE